MAHTLHEGYVIRKVVEYNMSQIFISKQKTQKYLGIVIISTTEDVKS